MKVYLGVIASMVLVSGTAYRALTTVPTTSDSARPIQSASRPLSSVAPDKTPAEIPPEQVWREVPQPEIHDQFASLDRDDPQMMASFGSTLNVQAADQAQAVVAAITTTPRSATHLTALKVEKPVAPATVPHDQSASDQPAPALDQPATIATQPTNLPAQQEPEPQFQLATTDLRLNTIAPAKTLNPGDNAAPIAMTDAVFATLTPADALPLGQDAKLVFQVASQALDQDDPAMMNGKAGNPAVARFVQIGDSDYFAVRDSKTQRMVIFARRQQSQTHRPESGTENEFQNDRLATPTADEQNEMLAGLQPVVAIDLTADQPLISLNRLTDRDLAEFHNLHTRLNDAIAKAPTHRSSGPV